MSNRFRVFVTLTLLAASAGAQPQPFPTSPPPDLPARPFALPPVESRTLPNGLEVVVAESHRVPLVSLRLGVRAGSILDPPGKPGLASAVARELTAGTDKYNSLQLSEAADTIGGAVRAAAGDDYAVVSASALSENLRPIVDLLADVVPHPSFPQSELDVYKSLTQQGLVVQRQNPAFLAQEQIAKAIYGPAHPYGVVSTTPEVVSGLTRDALEGFYGSHYHPGGSILVVVGDVKAGDVFSAVERALGSWSGGPESASTPPAPQAPSGRKIYLVDRPGSVQSNILIGNLALKRGDPDFYALTVANAILGGSSSSRLYLNVREKQGFAYDVHSSNLARGLAGDFTEAAQTRTEVTAPAIKEMLAEAQRLRTEPVREQELREAKNYISGHFVFSATTQSGLADLLLTQQMYGLPADYLSTYRERIQAVTPADIQRVAEKYMRPDDAAIVVVGDAAKLRDSLASIGPVQEVH